MYCEKFLSGGSLKPGESVVLRAVLDSRYLTFRENKQNSEARLTLLCLLHSSQYVLRFFLYTRLELMNTSL